MTSPPALHGLRALVTGSTAGVGLASVERLARLGARVVLNSRRAATVEETVARLRGDGLDVAGVPADISDPAEARRLVEDAVAALGGLDALCVNTGRPPALVPLPAATSLADWTEALHNQFTAIADVLDAALPYLRSSPTPAVAIVTSSTVKQPMADHVFSTVPRTATTALMKALARAPEWRGIRMNAVAPVSVGTETFLRHRSEEAVAARVAETPLGRLGTAAEFAAAVTFALSPDSHYLHGQTLFVDGGYRWALV